MKIELLATVMALAAGVLAEQQAPEAQTGIQDVQALKAKLNSMSGQEASTFCLAPSVCCSGAHKRDLAFQQLSQKEQQTACLGCYKFGVCGSYSGGGNSGNGNSGNGGGGGVVVVGRRHG